MTYAWGVNSYKCTRIQDHNGNYITLAYDSVARLATMTDTLGRIVTVNYGSNGLPSTITQTWKDTNGSGSNTTHTYVTFSYTTKTVDINFGSLAVVGPPDDTVLTVLDKITYADTSWTKFDYNGYLQVEKIENYADDDHKLNHVWTNLASVSGSQSDCPRFTETKTYAENFNSGNEVAITNTSPTSATYSFPGSITGTAAKIDITVIGDPTAGLFSRSWIANSGWQDGLPIASEDCISDCTGTNQKRWSWTNWTQDDTSKSYITNPRVVESRVGDGANTKRTTVGYGSNGFGLPEEVKVYDADLTTVLKTQTTSYSSDGAYLSRRIIGLPTESKLYEGTTSGSLMSKVTFGYDGNGYTGTGQSLSSATQHDTTNYGTGFSYRGNLTSQRRWDVTVPTSESASVESSTKYNIAGSPISKTTPWDGTNTRTVSISYTDSWNDGGSRTTYAYPTTLTDPANNSSTVKYRFDIGANVEATSPAPAGQTYGKTTKRIFDSLGRLERNSVYVNTTEKSYVRYEFPSNGIQSQSYSPIVDVDGDGNIAEDEVHSESWFDGAGRVRRSRTEHPGSSGGWSATQTEYDILGRVYRSSVPTEVSVSGSTWTAAGDDATRGWIWNYAYYDWKGRTVRTVPSDSTGSDGKDTLITYEGCGCAGGQVTTVQGPVTTAVDVAGNTQTTKRRTQKAYEDILGRTYKTEIWDLDGGGSAPYRTVKTTFNGRDQATLIREYAGADTSTTFQDTTATFDGHGRIYQSHRPEQRDSSNNLKYTTYSYNADDSISTVTDGRGAVTNYTYNSRALVTNIGWTVPSGSNIPDPADVTYSFDNLGNRTAMTDGSGTTNYSYDSLSQLTSETRAFNGLTGSLTLAYEYALTGQLKKLTDPDGVAINYGFDRTGRLSSVTGSGSLYSGVSDYASGFSYRAWGAVKGYSYGNSTSATLAYNSRLQVSSYTVTGVRPYENTNTQPEGGEFQYYNDGMLKFSTDLRSNAVLGGIHDKAFAYDHAGRLKNAYSSLEADNFGNGTTNTSYVTPFRHGFSYDSFDNPTSRTGFYWSEDDTGTETYDAYSRNTAWSYDADGRLITTNEPAPNALPYSPLTFGYDATGQSASSTYTISRPNPSNPSQTFTTIETRNNTFDGNGQLAKLAEIQQWNSGPPTSYTRYYLRSSLTGNVINEYDQNHTKLISTVYAGGQVLAQQVPSYPQPNMVVWQHQNPVTGDGVNNNSTGVTMDRATLDPTGVNIGDSDPFVAPGGEGQPIDPSQSAIDHMVAQMIPGWGGPKCYVDGALMGCHWAGSLLASGAGEEAVEASVWTRERRIDPRTKKPVYTPWQAVWSGLVRASLFDEFSMGTLNFEEKKDDPFSFINYLQPLSGGGDGEPCTYTAEDGTTGQGVKDKDGVCRPTIGTFHAETTYGSEQYVNWSMYKRCNEYGCWYDMGRIESKPTNQLKIAGFFNNFCSTAVGPPPSQYARWRGADGRFYTGPFSLQKAAKIGSRATFGIGTAISVTQVATGDVSPAQGSLDVAVGVIGAFGGPKGWAVAGTYFLYQNIPPPAYPDAGQRPMKNNVCHGSR